MKKIKLLTIFFLMSLGVSAMAGGFDPDPLEVSLHARVVTEAKANGITSSAEAIVVAVAEGSNTPGCISVTASVWSKGKPFTDFIFQFSNPSRPIMLVRVQDSELVPSI